ncbi:septum site-determining protein MinC [Propionispora hippei]|uniref:Probable septum site-determining protein MinC n=1 Tax=Propionispora hippei DSM 15287 TaxID=1123003 RepID=A0A1M6B4G8_9FIRM|nr:septum site-determining protein MinC [Propionispora hippei]SHI43498.1 septum site-determining protein MinC [Propionispora hippei DSM 15287]
MQEDVIFKGSKTGLQLLLNESADFGEIMQQLRRKLESAAKFFSNGAVVNISSAVRILTPEQQGQLTELFTSHGLSWSIAETALCVGGDTALAETTQASVPEELVIKKTLRNGQEIVYSGDIIVFGDINPGAQLIAGGDIIIYGTCRGVVHAGAYGDEQATITANKLMASQIRIAGLIARAPDHIDYPEYVETARVKDGAVIIEPAIL